jgi:hypothetical protein
LAPISSWAPPSPGEGSYSIAPDTFVNGSNGNAFDLTYVTGPTAWPSSGGALTVVFPYDYGLGTPTASNFYLSPANLSNKIGYSFNGRTVTVKLKDLGPGQSVVLRYGQNQTGFPVNTLAASEALTLLANPLSLTLTPSALAAQPTIAINSPTVTLTATVTPTFTISNTLTITPTHTDSPTITQTFTETPVGALKVNDIYSYPNPFDLAKFSKVTFRFPPDPAAKLRILNVAGELVKEIPSADIQGTKGFAIWKGRDDHNQLAAGGLYFVHLSGAHSMLRKFTVLN